MSASVAGTVAAPALVGSSGTNANGVNRMTGAKARSASQEGLLKAKEAFAARIWPHVAPARKIGSLLMLKGKITP